MNHEVALSPMRVIGLKVTLEDMKTIAGYLQKPVYVEANPYVAMTTTPGLDAETEVPVNAGFWIVMNPGFLQVRTNSLWIPFEKGG